MAAQLPLRSLKEEAEILAEIQGQCMRPAFVSARSVVTDFTGDAGSPTSVYKVLTFSWTTPVAMSIAGIEGALFMERGAAVTAFNPTLPAGVQISFASAMFFNTPATGVITSNEGNIIHHQYVSDFAPNNIYANLLPKGYYTQGGIPIYFHMFVSPLWVTTYTDAYFNMGITLYTITTGQRS